MTTIEITLACIVYVSGFMLSYVVLLICSKFGVYHLKGLPRFLASLGSWITLLFEIVLLIIDGVDTAVGRQDN